MADKMEAAEVVELFRRLRRGDFGPRTREIEDILQETMEGKRPLPVIGGVLGAGSGGVLRRGIDYTVTLVQPVRRRGRSGRRQMALHNEARRRVRAGQPMNEVQAWWINEYAQWRKEHTPLNPLPYGWEDSPEARDHFKKIIKATPKKK